jgi:peptidoglycan hydrolase FlgJ
MSIFPATDLVTEVAKAADPTRRDAAVARLSEISKATPNSIDGFATLMTDNHTAPPSPKPFVASPIATIGSGPTGLSSIRPGEATQKFEAFIIQSSLETILPKSEGGFFGRGTAGDVWRSMIAEQIGDQIAKAGGLGLRKLLDHDLSTRAAPPKTS